MTATRMTLTYHADMTYRYGVPTPAELRRVACAYKLAGIGGFELPVLGVLVVREAAEALQDEKDVTEK